MERIIVTINGVIFKDKHTHKCVLCRHMMRSSSFRGIWVRAEHLNVDSRRNVKSGRYSRTNANIFSEFVPFVQLCTFLRLSTFIPRKEGVYNYFSLLCRHKTYYHAHCIFIVCMCKVSAWTNFGAMLTVVYFFLFANDRYIYIYIYTSDTPKITLPADATMDWEEYGSTGETIIFDDNIRMEDDYISSFRHGAC